MCVSVLALKVEIGDGQRHHQRDEQRDGDSDDGQGACKRRTAHHKLNTPEQAHTSDKGGHGALPASIKL